MKRQYLKYLAVAALCMAAPAQAARDAGLSLNNSRNAGFRNSLGAQLGFTLRLDNARVVRAADRFNLRMSAGPIMSRNDGRQSAATLFAVNLSPGYRTELSFAGRPVATRYTAVGFADAQARGLDGANRSGITTLGWVGIGAGALVGVLGITYLALEDAIDCTENGQYVCE